MESWTRAHAAAMSAACAAALATGRTWPCAAVALVSFAFLGAGSRRQWAARAGTLAPNGVTALRFLAIVALAFAPDAPAVLWAAAVAIVFALDAVDGWLARSLNASTEFGATFDMEVDAWIVLAVGLELFFRGRLGSWILVPGLLRYAYVLLVAWVPARGGEVPRSTLGRNAFGALMIGLCAALAWGSGLGAAAAAFGTAAVALSFAHSFYWSYLRRPRAFPTISS